MIKLAAQQQGFTLLELIVVIAVIAILSGALIYGIPKWQETARLESAMEMGHSMVQGTIAYCATNPSATLTAAATDTKIPPYVNNTATSWNSLTVSGTTAVTPTFGGGTCSAVSSDLNSALTAVKWTGGCANSGENITYTTATNSAACN
jgi:prepilin-type N-terminal cleavage/methylation domain-containing protein